MTDLLEAAKAYMEKLNEIDTAEFGAGAERKEREALEAAIERAEKPDLDLHDQVEAKRKHNCPDCETETDTDRNNGAHGDVYTEYCMNDDCEWEMKLGTVTESLS